MLNSEGVLISEECLKTREYTFANLDFDDRSVAMPTSDDLNKTHFSLYTKQLCKFDTKQLCKFDTKQLCKFVGMLALRQRSWTL